VTAVEPRLTPAESAPVRRGEVPRALRGRHVSFRWRPRVLAVGAIFVSLTMAVAVWTMMLGEYPVPPWEVITTTLGAGSGEYDLVVRTLRLPRTLTALLVGVALATSGAIFQGLVRNPLVAPDIIGVTSGASLAAVATIVLGGPVGLLPVAAFAGAVATAFAVYALTWRAGIAGGRLVLVGIGINAVLAAGTTFLLVRFPIERITPAVLWLTGTLHARSWRHVSWVGVGVAVFLPLALVLLRLLRVLQLGDETAVALGVRVEPTRAGLLIVGAGLAAVAVAVAGPVGFVALMVPHAVRLLVGPLTGGTLLVTGAAGSLLVAASDLVAQHAFSPLSIPVGVVTAAVGAPYFLYLLHRSNREL
jgi:iron complex transport system permease protein